MKTLSAFILSYLLYIPFIKELVIYLDIRMNKRAAGVSDWLAEILPCEQATSAPWAENHLPLEKSKVALITIGGLFAKDKEPFREQQWGGDFSYRLLPQELEVSRLKASKFLLDHRLTQMDPNLVFPIDRLKTLKSEGVIQELAKSHYSFLGYCTDRRPLIGGSAKEVARKLRYEGVDKVLVIAGSVLGQQTAVYVQRAIEQEGIPTVSLIYSANVATRLKASRACILKKPSLCRLEEYLDHQVQKDLVRTLLKQFDECKKAGEWVTIE